MKRFKILIIALMASSVAFAGGGAINGSVTGRVIDALTGDPFMNVLQLQFTVCLIRLVTKGVMTSGMECL
ncbi:MAG: hypothetical protein R2744_10295 [Bacteroidales bacterium]